MSTDGEGSLLPTQPKQDSESLDEISGAAPDLLLNMSIPSQPSLSIGMTMTEQSKQVPALLADWVSQIAWSPGSRKAAIRLEIGKGELAGTLVMVQEERGMVAVEIELPVGQSAEDWEDRLHQRFQRQGLVLEKLMVRAQRPGH